MVETNDMVNPSLLLRLGGIAIIAAAIYWSVMAIHDWGYRAHQSEVAAAQQVEQEKAFEQYFDEVETNQKLALKLAESQAHLATVSAKHAAYARRITGNCDPKLRVLVSYAASATNIPTTTTGKLDDTTAAGRAIPTEETLSGEDLADLASNIATNYTRHHQCVEQLNALITYEETTTCK
jgi:hypothetical protein